jgi:chitin synthase
MACIGQPAVLPLILLALILGLPAVLIVMTSRKFVYVCWMLVYLISLPIWNFVLPVYAYWHFDDFSWGDTRKVEGSSDSDKKKEALGHGDKDGEFDSSKITMKKWSDYEKDRRTQLAIERNLPIPRFLERPRSALDIFKDQQQQPRLNHNNNRKPGSAGSDDSDTPLTYTAANASPTHATPHGAAISHSGDISDLPLPRSHQFSPLPLIPSTKNDPDQSHLRAENTTIAMDTIDQPGKSDHSNAISPLSSPPLHPPPSEPPTEKSNSNLDSSVLITPSKLSQPQQQKWNSTSTWADPAPHHQSNSP